MEQVKQHIKYSIISENTGVTKSTIKKWATSTIKNLGTGKSTVFSLDEELNFISCLHHMSDYWFPVDRNTLQNLVQSYCRHAKKKNPFTDDRPGNDWAFAFEQRHKAILKYTKEEPLSRARASGMTRENIDGFFEMYSSTLEKYNLLDKPWLIFNTDETGFQACQGTSKVYHRANTNPYTLTANNLKALYTVSFCTSATGQYLPPYVVYKAKNMYDTWTKGGPKDAGYSCSDSGWMHTENFEAWFFEMFIPHCKKIAPPGQHCALIYDGHNSHIYKLIRAAIDNNIIIICLPPNTTHATQPLDLGVFVHLKKFWHSECKKWFAYTTKNISKPTFPKKLKSICENLTPVHSIGGWEGTGLWPINKNKLEDKILKTSVDSEVHNVPQSRQRTKNCIKKAIHDVLGPQVEKCWMRPLLMVRKRGKEWLIQKERFSLKLVLQRV